MDDSLILNHLAVDIIYTIDSRHFLDKKNLINWVEYLDDDKWETKLKKDFLRSNEISSLESLYSYYANTGREEKTTLPSPFYQSTPLVVSFKNTKTLRTGIFNIQLNSFFISHEGVLSVSFKAKLLQSEHECLTVPEAILELAVIRKQCHKLLLEAFEELIWPSLESSTGLKFSRSDFDKHKIYHIYEIIDFDYQASNNAESKNFYRDLTLKQTRELVGLLRLSRSGIWGKYSEKFLREYLNKNLGNRDDELWMITDNRLFRLHPERTIKSDVDLWFSDLKSMIMIVHQKRASLDFLVLYLSNKLKNIRYILLNSTLAALRETREHLSWLDRFSHTSFDPLAVERYIENTFLKKILREILVEQQIPNLHLSVKERVADLHMLISTFDNNISNYSSFINSENTEKLSKKVYVLTWLVFLLTLSQLIIAIPEGVINWIVCKLSLPV